MLNSHSTSTDHSAKCLYKLTLEACVILLDTHIHNVNNHFQAQQELAQCPLILFLNLVTTEPL